MKNHSIVISLLLVASCAQSSESPVAVPTLSAGVASNAVRDPLGNAQDARSSATRANATDGSRGRRALPFPTPQTPVDLTISDNVRQAILQDRSVQAEAGNVHVETQDGVVTLTGSVKSVATKQRIGLVVNAVGSVVRVDNQLVVDASAPPSTPQGTLETTLDRAISERVRQALLDDKGVAAEAANVRVFTKDGVVELSGSVSNLAVKQRMSVVANAVGSVARVDNQLAAKTD